MKTSMLTNVSSQDNKFRTENFYVNILNHVNFSIFSRDGPPLPEKVKAATIS